jgi:hypothetical protein
MKQETFQQILHELRWEKPPQPFVIELMDGRRIEVDEPNAVAVNEKAAVFLNPDYEFVEFSTDDVQAIHPSTAGQAS